MVNKFELILAMQVQDYVSASWKADLEAESIVRFEYRKG